MNITFTNENIHQIEQIGSLGIRAEIERIVKEKGSCVVEGGQQYAHPSHTDSADWCIYLFTVDGWRVASTNGDPVWEEQDMQAFAELLEEYIAEGEYTYEISEGSFYKLVRCVGREDAYYITDLSNNRVSCERPDVDGDWSGDLTGNLYGAGVL